MTRHGTTTTAGLLRTFQLASAHLQRDLQIHEQIVEYAKPILQLSMRASTASSW